MVLFDGLVLPIYDIMTGHSDSWGIIYESTINC